MRFQFGPFLLVLGLMFIWFLRSIDINLPEIKYHPKYPGAKIIHFWEKPVWVSPYSFQNCQQKCEITEGEYIPANADVVIFHSPYLWLTRAPEKPRGQIWVFFSMEPPVNHKLSFNNWYNVFNWTMTYRRDSDILYPYGIFRNSTSNNRIQKKIKPRNKKTAAWFVSNCHTQSKREEFGRLLQKYIDIDIYGKCGSHICDRQGSDASCLERLDNAYNFYLSLESNLCRDYVTEKFFKIYKLSNVIPVVRGHVNYEMYGPVGSFIDTSGFTSPVTFSRHLVSVATNEELFSTFFQYKNRYYMDDGHEHPFCELCRRVHNASSYQRLYGNIGHWLSGSDLVPICSQPKDLKLL
ncbi:alpha-(1,3)-fucosyltransferase C-like [Ylistrum balloti]|uniref:alpha-(1,3)-fucosyltransferase C-like n=1 Tax=Ylistrum balloti TaxID=509963 RepID=UPI002905C179|nr:alpha-(1,3)-fucosyltransferase C-like [Ylistrum balloti]